MRLHGIVGGAGLAALAIGVWASATQAASDPPRIVPWHKIGSVSIGMQKEAVVYRYGYAAPYEYASARYHVPGGNILIDYGNKAVGFSDRVIQIETNSSRYRTATGLGVGSTVPLPPCRKEGRLCLHHWNGFTLWHDPTTGQPAWQRYDFYSGKKIVVELLMNGSSISDIIFGMCGAAWGCNPQTVKG